MHGNVSPLSLTARNFIVGTAGHVDHGKSALVKALTGTDPDRLPDEKARGITIDLGFAHLDLPAPLSTLNSQLPTLSVGIVDVPGHEDFVKNMIAGAGSIDLALFVVAADDGWMPQTEEHLEILTYLGVKKAIIALTKTDLADANETAINVCHQLSGTPFEHAPVVQTSTLTGVGLAELKEAIARELSTLAPQPDLEKPRLFVDRAFSLHGVGTVVTGTLVGGRLVRGQHVIVQPANIATRIRAIQSHNREQEMVGPGTRTALNLTDVAVAGETGSAGRGDVVTISELGEPVNTIDVLLTRSSRTSAVPNIIKNGASVYLHHGTNRLPARVALADGKNLEPGGSAIAQLRLDSSILAFVGDRFVLRDPSERRTIAGGVILEVGTARAQFREAKLREFLDARAKAPLDATVALRSELRRDGAKEHVDLLLRSHFSTNEIEAAMKQLVSAKELVMRGDIVADANWWEGLRERAIAAIETEHEKHPQLPGLDLAQLRSVLGRISPKIFDGLVVDLCREGYARTGNLIRKSAHRPVLSSHLGKAAEGIRRLILETPLDPPARKRIAPDPKTRQALGFLIEQGEIVEIGSDVILSREAFSQMKEIVTAFIARNGPATVSDLRQALGTSRRVVVPFLEQLDRNRITRRNGDQRTLVETVATAQTGLE